MQHMSQASAEVQSMIDYLVPTSRINRRFWAPGRELNTGVYAPYPVTIRNARLAPASRSMSMGSASLSITPRSATGRISTSLTRPMPPRSRRRHVDFTERCAERRAAALYRKAHPDAPALPRRFHGERPPPA
jgi:hypothetical protein